MSELSSTITVARVRRVLGESEDDLHGIQLKISSQEAAAEIAAAREDIKRAMSRLTDALAIPFDS